MAGEIERLQAWKYGHKARSVTIQIDDGYGATCWTVDLTFERTGGVVRSYTSEMVLMGEDGDWPGLAATIAAALDGFDALKAKGGT